MEPFKVEITESELKSAAEQWFPDYNVDIILYSHYFLVEGYMGDIHSIEVYSDGTMECNSSNFSIPFIDIAKWGINKGLW